ncbi:hypothetical protein ABL975_28475 [Pseudomonas aeruginosa]|uniref:hypothetical protein n=1 Tax=Pseudomonas TaxID=286 RepID=UPI0005A89C9E|nr:MULTISPECIES: hypothetical protein [Pseudomonas]EKX2115211.1 hypothetical protein [Pseudomonas aeruginosa]KQK62694.1 hypothetical protein AOX61_30080 [Pseudomonas aeruginosa]KQK64449.1 hypothetical protein AOX62_25710 [Pseudomonas aeruginosa]MBA5144045.1 hypothetical protein [Pseudomonas aeruginosa]MBH4317265.1 hypothetical protein [Pseudomonas aeruginosa]
MGKSYSNIPPEQQAKRELKFLKKLYSLDSPKPGHYPMPPYHYLTLREVEHGLPEALRRVLRLPNVPAVMDRLFLRKITIDQGRQAYYAAQVSRLLKYQTPRLTHRKAA